MSTENDTPAPKVSPTAWMIAYLPLGSASPARIKNFSYNPDLDICVWGQDRFYETTDPEDMAAFMEAQHDVQRSVALKQRRVRFMPVQHRLDELAAKAEREERAKKVEADRQAQRDANAAAAEAAAAQEDEESTDEEVEDTPDPESTDTPTPDETPEVAESGPDPEAEEVEEEETDEPVKPYDEWTVPELKEEATVRELEFASKITKAKIIELLEADDAAQAD